jgi:recombination protein RecR
MASYTRPIQDLIDRFAKLPGIGPRSAERIVFHLLKQQAPDALALADAITALKTRIRHCSRCYNLAEERPGDVVLCDICADASRDPGVVCVVEQPKDLLALEATGLFKGVYHVLLGRLAPLDGVEAGDLTIDALLDRVGSGQVREVILATNPTLDGDLTSNHIADAVRHRAPAVNVTRLARGLASGTQIEYANRGVLEDALRGRRSVG